MSTVYYAVAVKQRTRRYWRKTVHSHRKSASSVCIETKFVRFSLQFQTFAHSYLVLLVETVTEFVITVVFINRKKSLVIFCNE